MLAMVLAVCGWTTALNLGIHLWLGRAPGPAKSQDGGAATSGDTQSRRDAESLAHGADTERPEDRPPGSRSRRLTSPADLAPTLRRAESNDATTPAVADSDLPPELIAEVSRPPRSHALDEPVIQQAQFDSSDVPNDRSVQEPTRRASAPAMSGAAPMASGARNGRRRPLQVIATDPPLLVLSETQPPAQDDGPKQEPEKAFEQTPRQEPAKNGAANVQDPMGSDSSVSAPSSLLGQLGRAQERATQSAAPAASGVDASSQTSAIDTTQLARQSNSAGSISGVRRSPVSVQPVVRGYQQQQIYGQYQGAHFVPVRYDFDSILSNVDPGLIDNLIIISGPYGVKYGPGLAFIDVVAAPTPRSDCIEWHSRTNLLYQTNGNQLYGRETISGGGPDYGMRVSYGHKIGNDYEAGNDNMIPASYSVRDVDIAVGLDLSENSSLEIEYLSQDLNDTEYAGLIFDADFRKTDGWFLRYTCKDELSCAQWQVDAWINRTHFQGDNLNPSKQFFYRNNIYFSARGTSFFPDVAFVGYTEAEVTNAGFRIAPTWGEDDGVQITAGLDLHYIEYQLDELDDFTDNTLQFSLTGFDSYPVLPSKSVDPGLFVELKAPVNDQLKLAAGARVDWMHTEADGRHRVIAPDFTRPLIFGLDEMPRDTFEEFFETGLTKNDVLAAAFVSADYEVAECLDLRLGFGHGQRPPSLTERYAYFPFLTVIQDATNAPLGTPNLDPERASQFDLALIGDYDATRFRIAGFCSLVQDFISFDFFTFASAPDVPVLVFANTDATLAGFEFSAEHDLACQWTTFANVSLVDGRDRRRDRPLPSISPFESRLGIRWHDPENKHYGVEFSARIVENQDRLATELGEGPTPGFTVYDLKAYWQVNDQLRLTAGIDNLTNKNYLEHLSVHDPRVLEPGFNLYTAIQLDY
jgi:outer membrane receptor protein involved in Fe transport